MTKAHLVKGAKGVAGRRQICFGSWLEMLSCQTLSGPTLQTVQRKPCWNLSKPRKLKSYSVVLSRTVSFKHSCATNGAWMVWNLGIQSDSVSISIKWLQLHLHPRNDLIASSSFCSFSI
jgi:hypothetical protein